MKEAQPELPIIQKTCDLILCYAPTLAAMEDKQAVAGEKEAPLGTA